MAIVRTKVLIAESAGGELAYSTELALDASNVFFASTATNAADNVQDAISNAAKGLNSLYAESTDTITSASTTLTTDAALTLTPGAGTFGIWYSAQSETTGLSCRGEVELFKNAAGILSSIRQVDSNIAGGGIGGLTGLSIAAPISIVARVTFAAGDQLLVRYRCADRGTLGLGTYFLTQRSLLMIQTSQT